MRSDLVGAFRPTGRELAHGVITVTDSITAIPATNQKDRKAIMLRNCSSGNKIYIGNSTVTTTNGFWLHPNETLPFDVSDGCDIFGICETGQTAEVRYIELDNG